jgi:hypothetical protein
MDLRSPDVADAETRDGGQRLNAEVPWDAFDAAAYVENNYRFLRSDDSEILETVRDHFSACFQQTPKTSGRQVLGIDVGAGANLYPALAMLPWCDSISLLERSAANVEYLLGQRASYDAHWDEFWQLLCKEDAYSRLTHPRELFRGSVHVEQGDLFGLGRHEGRWSLGTMFFVAESMSTSHQEFEAGVACFMRALAPGAPFAAAFMEGSQGYKVGERFFPACSVTGTEVRDSLEPYAEGKVTITPIGMPDGALRPGYEGMIVACGRRNSA